MNNFECLLLQMMQYLFDKDLIFNTRHDLHRPTTRIADLYIEEDAL
ncbi:hypothetical protein ACFL17_10285 [Pseudomonadota bacterium]